MLWIYLDHPNMNGLVARPLKGPRKTNNYQKVSQPFLDANRGIYGRRRIAASIVYSEEKPVSMNRAARNVGELKIAGYNPPAFKKHGPICPLEDSPKLIKNANPHRSIELRVSGINYIGSKE